MFLVNIFFWFVGFFLFLFIFWKKLKEDYIPKQTFSVAFLTLTGLLLGYFLGNKYLKDYWFWTALGLSFLSFVLSVVRKKMKFFETFESFTLTFLVFYAMFFLHNFLASFKPINIYAFLVTLVVIIFYIIINKTYKKFAWYKSGRLGFSSLATTGIFFLIRSVVALTLPSVISFGGKVDAVLSAIVAFAAFLTLFNLAKKT